MGFGVGFASQGEVQANLTGVALQLSAILLDAIRCTLLQVAMQHSEVKLSPAETLLHVAPRAAVFIGIPAAVLEGRRLCKTQNLPIGWLALSCVLASSLNLLAFSLIKSTSALTTSVTGPLKEWVCIIASVLAYNDPITLNQIVGYIIALCGIFWYQFDKFFVQGAEKS